MSNQRLLDKLRALLARADEKRNDNKHEREIAMRQAQHLMDQHNISIAEVELDETPTDTRGRSDAPIGASLWPALIYQSISQLYGVKVYRSGRGRFTHIVMIGAEHNRIACQLMSQYVIRSIEREAKKYKGSGRSFLHSFKTGAATGVGQQVSAIVAARYRGETLNETGNAMVLADYYKNEMILNNKYLQKAGVHLSQSRGTRPRNGNAYYAGKAYGSQMSLNNQLGQRGGQRMLK